MVTNSTIETLLNRRSIRKFVAEPFDDDTVATLETVAQHAASSQYLNDWSAVRVKAPALKPRMPRELQFFDDVYPSDDDATESIKERIGAFDVSVHEYYDLRNTDRPVDAFSDQIASIAAQRMDATHQVIPNATSQGFRLDR